MPHRVLLEEQVQANLQKGEHVRDYIHLRLHVDFCKPSDTDILAYLNLQRWPVASEYDWIDAKVASTPSTLSIGNSIDAIDIVVRNPLEWLTPLDRP